MFKYIITAIIIALFAGCSAPKPDRAPTWYTSPPTDFHYFYATASDADKSKAKKKAIASLRHQINTQLDNAFKNRDTKLKIKPKQDISPILSENEYLANTISMRNIHVEKTAIFKKQHLVLIKLQRKTIFDKVDRTATKQLHQSKTEFDNVQNEIAIKRFIVYDELMKSYPKLASLTQAKIVTLPSYNASDDFRYLNELQASYIQLKEDISFYVLSDMNSRMFTSSVKNAIKKTGLVLSAKPKSKDSIKLFITSQTVDSQDYSFNQSKSLIKFTSYDINKKEVAFRQHTFIGKSRKSHKEAKQQSALHVKAKVKQLGIFNFLGFK